MFELIKQVAIFTAKKVTKIDPLCPVTQDNVNLVVDIVKAIVNPF